MAETDHILVPKHSKLTKKAKEELLKKYNISLKQLPKILIKDPAIQSLGAEVGDVIEIERKSATAGISKYYRVVVNE